jgi:protein-disulfide isomerase
MERYPKEVKFVMKNFPLVKIHKSAKPASHAALAANKQGKFWEFHEKLFKNYRVLNEEKIIEIAKELGLDMEVFSKDRKSQSIKSQVSRDLYNGRQAGVRGTPTVFINGKVLRKRNLKGFENMIEAQLKKLKK